MNHIKECLDTFLDADAPGVVAVKGDWGAGKTYFVTKYLRERKQLHEKLAAFVSLFGLSSVEQIQRQIIPSAISSKALSEGKGRNRLDKILGLARKLPKLSEIELFLRAVEDQITRDMLIIFDDVERKSKDLDLKSFLGFVNFLSEHANCKVIIILNESELENPDKNELARFREKLLDREILFHPSIEDNARLFFLDDTLFDQAVEIFNKCACRNLRVIKRCYQNSIAFEKRFKTLGKESKAFLLRQVVFLSCLFYQYGPEIDFEKLSDSAHFIMFSSPENAEKIKGNDILKKSGYWPSDWDEFIINYLKSGLFDENAAILMLGKTLKSASRDEVLREQTEIYKSIQTNFQSDTIRFTTNLSTFLDSHQQDLTWSEIVCAVNYLKNFSFEGDATKWTDNFIIRSASSFSLKECTSFMSIASSQTAKDAIDQRRRAIFTSRTPREIIYSMVGHRGWDPEDTAALNLMDAQSFANWLIEERDEKLLATLNRFVITFNPKATDGECRQIGEKIFAAFQIIALNNSLIQHQLIHFVGIPADVFTKPSQSDTEPSHAE